MIIDFGFVLVVARLLMVLYRFSIDTLDVMDKLSIFKVKVFLLVFLLVLVLVFDLYWFCFNLGWMG